MKEVRESLLSEMSSSGHDNAEPFEAIDIRFRCQHCPCEIVHKSKSFEPQSVTGNTRAPKMLHIGRSGFYSI